MVTQLTAGTITFLFLSFPEYRSAKNINKLADDPEFTSTEYSVPSQLDHSSSNLTVSGPFVYRCVVFNQLISCATSSSSIICSAKFTFIQVSTLPVSHLPYLNADFLDHTKLWGQQLFYFRFGLTMRPTKKRMNLQLCYL